MKITSTNLYKLLEAYPKGLTVKEILKLMGQDQRKKTNLRKTIKSMAALSLIVKKNARYMLTGEPLVLSRQERRREEIAAKKEKKAKGPARVSGSLKHRGIYLWIKNEPYLQPLGMPGLLPVESEDALVTDLVHSDEVFFEEVEGKARVTAVLGRRINEVQATLLPKEGKVYASAKSKSYPDRLFVSNLNYDPALQGRRAFLNLQLCPTGPAKFVQLIPELSLEELYQPTLDSFRIKKEFPENVSRETSAFAESDIRLTKTRKDLTKFPFFTIDGEDAKDYDDAIYARQEGENFRIFVAIADVSEYVRFNTELDQEAQKRATSVYLPGFVAPMLPEVLSNGLCSLQADKKRYALTAEMLVDGQGSSLEFEVYESVIQVERRLTYTEVDRLFNKEKTEIPAKLQRSLFLYKEIAEVLRHKRKHRGAVGFTLPDVYFDFDKDWKLKGIHKTFQTPAQKLIEEFMLEANEQVGHYVEENKLNLLWRNHPEPLPQKLKDLKDMLWNEGIKVSEIESGKDYNKILEQAKDHQNRQAIEYSLLRSMSLALYEAGRIGHFGLAATHYLHFTSPIRRYPDLVVHRSIKAHLHGQPKVRVPKWMGEHCSDQERNAQKAEREAQKVQRMLFMSDRIGEIFEARVTGMVPAGLFVEIGEPYVEGFLPFAKVLDDHYRVDRETNKATGKVTKRVIQPGQGLQVMLSGLDFRNNSLNLDWLYFH